MPAWVQKQQDVTHKVMPNKEKQKSFVITLKNQWLRNYKEFIGVLARKKKSYEPQSQSLNKTMFQLFAIPAQILLILVQTSTIIAQLEFVLIVIMINLIIQKSYNSGRKISLVFNNFRKFREIPCFTIKPNNQNQKKTLSKPIKNWI